MAWASEEKKRAYQAAYYKRNRAKILVQKKQYAEEHWDAIKARKRARWVEKSARVCAALRRRRREFKLAAVDAAGGKCNRCGFDNPGALEFHHKDPNEKQYEVARCLDWASQGGSLSGERLRAELAKCELLCRNCHVVEHWGNGGKTEDVNFAPNTAVMAANY